MDTEFTNGKMETDMKVNGGNLCDMVKVKIFLPMEIILLASTNMDCRKGKVNTSGKTEIFMTDNLNKHKNMGMEFGRILQMTKIQTFIKASI